MARAPTDIRSLARSHTSLAIKVLAGLAKDGTNEGARVAACVALLDRGWGKPEQSHEMNADIQITIRQILDDPKSIADNQKVIDVTPTKDKPK